MSGDAPGLQNQCGARKSSGWVRFPFASATSRLKGARARIGLALLLISAGVGMLVYGAVFRTVPVFEPKPATAPVAGTEAELAGGDLLPATPAAPETAETLIQARTSEPELVLETTVGGVTRSASGRITRTYTEEPPAECPT